jgi:hypothetical protein
MQFREGEKKALQHFLRSLVKVIAVFLEAATGVRGEGGEGNETAASAAAAVKLS